MDKSLLLPLLLLLLGAFSFLFFQGVAPTTLCMSCHIFKKGRCLEGEGNCTVEQGRGCRTTDMYFFNARDGYRYNHTKLDCSNECKAWKLARVSHMASVFCCQGPAYCNKYRGRSLRWKPK